MLKFTFASYLTSFCLASYWTYILTYYLKYIIYILAYVPTYYLTYFPAFYLTYFRVLSSILPDIMFPPTICILTLHLT